MFWNDPAALTNYLHSTYGDYYLELLDQCKTNVSNINNIVKAWH